jgi:hypothetical protein
MLRARSSRVACLLAIVTVVASVGAVGWAKTKSRADGTLHYEVRDLGGGLVGWTWGHGTLTYKGKKYPFKVDGLVVDAVGAERQDATGEVYHLGTLANFEGTYRAVDVDAAAGSKGVGVEKLRNDKGVHITLHTKDKGFGATAGPEGVKITLEH